MPQKLALLDIEYDEGHVEMLTDQFPRCEVIFHLTNVGRKHDVENAFQEIYRRFRAVDIVITCAGILNEQHYEEMVDVNLVCITF